MRDLTFTKPDFGKNPIEFLKEVRVELSKVAWPNRPAVIRLTAIVLGVSAFVGAYLAGLDFIFTKLASLLLNK